MNSSSLIHGGDAGICVSCEFLDSRVLRRRLKESVFCLILFWQPLIMKEQLEL